MVNVIVGLVVAFWGVADLSVSVEVVLDVNTHGADAVCKTNCCDIRGCPTGLGCLNEATRTCHVVGENGDSSRRGCPMGWVHLNVAQ
jgi:hypothetical protein